MVTVSNVVNSLVNKKIFVQEAMNKDIISYCALARKLKPEIELILEKKVKQHAIEMALRRYNNQLKEKHVETSFVYKSDIVMKTQIIVISITRSSTLIKQLKKLYDLVEFSKGDILNIIHGNYEVSIITNERFKEKFLSILKNEKILNVEEDLISVTMTFPDEYYHRPCVIFHLIRNIAWENINIFEIISTNTELTFIIHKKDTMKTYKSLEKLIPQES